VVPTVEHPAGTHRALGTAEISAPEQVIDFRCLNMCPASYFVALFFSIARTGHAEGADYTNVLRLISIGTTYEGETQRRNLTPTKKPALDSPLTEVENNPWAWLAGAAVLFLLIWSLVSAQRSPKPFPERTEEDEEWARFGAQQLQDRYPEWDTPTEKSV